MKNLLIILILVPLVTLGQEVGSKKKFRKVLKGVHAQFVSDDGEGIEYYNEDRAVWKIDWQDATLTYAQYGEFPSEPISYPIDQAYEDDNFLEVRATGRFEIAVESLDGTIDRSEHDGEFLVTFDKNNGVIIYRYGDGKHIVFVSDEYYKSQTSNP